jgi:transposase
MNAREERGLVIAATQKLVQKGKVWLVPSQSGKGKYTVCPDPESPYCSCPDHESTGQPCKHLYAVEFAVKREQGGNGTVVETRTLTFTRKKTYTQNWPAYNLSQITEKNRLQVLLRDLCKGIEEPPQKKVGRRRTLMADMVFSSVFKVYCGMSNRRYGCDLNDAFEKGYLSERLHPMTICSFLQNEALTPVLQKLIGESATPLRVVESVFAPDSTGFCTNKFVRWFDHKYGCPRQEHDWVKVHALVGTRTNVVCSVTIEGRDAADCPQFKPLVEQTVGNGFTVKEVPADKAYLSHENLQLVHDLGGTAYIPFKSNSTPGEAGSIWEKMYLYYQLHREEFEKHYHQRSNVESTFSAVKAKFGDSVRSKSSVAVKNEALCKVLAHNLCCLILSHLELGIEPVFWGNEPTIDKLQEQPEIGEVVDAEVVEKMAIPALEAPVARSFCVYVGA